MDVWNFIKEKLDQQLPVELLYVIDSEGSSPGRKGFAMAVSTDQEICGTIGGGIMEYKLVEKAKSILLRNDRVVFLVRQYHDKDSGSGHSGMICSGSQLIAFIPLGEKEKAVIDRINESPHHIIRLSPGGVAISDENAEGLNFVSDEDWSYSEPVNRQPVIHIIGGGHVSLALSELMCFLGFYSKVYDDRPQLNTLLQNYFANEKIPVPAYEKIDEYITDCSGHFAVIMTTGYRTDKIALQRLLNKDFTYLGVLGSVKKRETIFAELSNEGVDPSMLEKVYMPVGVDIYSKSATEIAVSIAAEIIREKNRGLPTGRQL